MNTATREKKNIAKSGRMSTANMQNEGKSTGLRMNISASASDTNITSPIRHVNVVEGRPRFAYGGYNFEIVQAWPHGWSYNDNTYIDFVDGGYYLFNDRHPGVRVAVTVLP